MKPEINFVRYKIDSRAQYSCCGPELVLGFTAVKQKCLRVWYNNCSSVLGIQMVHSDNYITQFVGTRRS